MIEEGRSPTLLIENSLDDHSFEGEEIAVLNYIRHHFQKFGKMPNAETVEREVEVKFGKFPDEPLGYWMDGVRNRYQEKLMIDAMKSVQRKIGDGFVDEAREEIQSLGLRLREKFAADTVRSLWDAGVDVLKAQRLRQMSSKMSGVPFGFEYLDELSDGAQPSDTVALVGRPGTGKSYLLFASSLYAHSYGETPLVVNFEMSSLQCARRIIALDSGVNVRHLRVGQTDHFKIKKINKLMDDLSKLDNPFYLMQGSLKSTVEDLALVIQEKRPSVVYIDGAYMLRTRDSYRSRWERIADVAEYIKLMATEFNIPIIATYQFSRKGSGSIDHIGGSDEIGKLASIVCGLTVSEREGIDGVVYNYLSILKGREGEQGVIELEYDFNRMTVSQFAVVAKNTIKIKKENTKKRRT